MSCGKQAALDNKDKTMTTLQFSLDTLPKFSRNQHGCVLTPSDDILAAFILDACPGLYWTENASGRGTWIQGQASAVTDGGMNWDEVTLTENQVSKVLFALKDATNEHYNVQTKLSRERDIESILKYARRLSVARGQ